MEAHQASPSLDFSGKNTGVGCHFLLQGMKVKSESEDAQSCPTLATRWTAACQAPLPMGFSRQKYWSGVPLPSPIILATILKYLGSILIKFMQDLYIEYHKDCWNKLDINKQVYCVHKFKNTKRSSVFPSFIYRQYGSWIRVFENQTPSCDT